MTDLNLTPDRDATSFASSSTFPSHGYVYDVFINHRGPDGKKTLASHIYLRLKQEGLAVFLDQQELQEGENITPQIEGAIRTASVHVAVFSPGYANSRWCLDELKQMLESGSTIIPVFCGVGPSDLRFTTGENGVYGRALRMLERKRTFDCQPRYDSKTINQWRDALSAVADLSGFDLKACNDDEGQLVDNVVQQILRKLRKPIGLNEKIKDVERILSLQPQRGGAKVVGIVGPGGIGKTTLAKEFFNRKRSNYDRSCFLADVRSSSLPSLQSILIKDLTQSKVQINSVDEGKKYLSSSNNSDMALIVLDDVDHVDQLDALFWPVKDTIHPDSLMLVTSRHKDVLTSSGIAVSSIYTVEGLNAQHSRELFCSHAFGNPHPVEGFDEVVKKFLDVCDGLPLSLKVLGAPLRGNYNLKFWNEQLHKISKILPSDTRSCVKVIYDALDKEEKLVDTDVRQILKKIKPPLNLPKYLTGLDEKIKDVERTLSLQRQSGGSRVVGIVGPGGIGKTTLAKGFFNREMSNYDRSCFLADVRSSSLPSLQSILVKDLTQSKVQINSVDEGKRYLSSFNEAYKALMVLDDVDHSDQLDALFSQVKDTIDPGSLILVTSRNKDVLRSSGIAESSIYKVEGLNAQHSRELFCSHAFGNPHPVAGFDEVVKKSLDASAGLPLSLEVLGALLSGKNYLRELLHKTSVILPSGIRSCLKVSYDGLDGEEKEMFLDIACFFIGEDRDTAIRVWDASGWKGSLGLRTLEDRFLVEIDSKYRIRMHDHLRHLGRDLAENKPPGCELRLWRPTNKLPHNLSAQSPVRGISMVHGNLAQQFWEKLAGSCNLSRLQLLRVRGYSVESIFSVGQLPQLAYLHWENCPNSFLPSWNPLKNLRVLYIQGKNLETLWQHESQAPLQLRELNMDAPLLKVPKSIGKLKHLEKFVLHQSFLETLPDEFCHLHSLIHVELKNCQEIRLLPDSVGNLTNLQSLDLSECSNLEMLPYSLGNLRNLQRINLSKCSNLRMLPNSLDNLKYLQHMYLSCCSNLQILPNSLGNLQNLQHIDLSRCLNLQMLPNSFGNLTNLQHIDLSGCSSLPILPNSFGNLIQLKHLCLRKCYDLTISTETLGQIRTLEWLEISGCYGIDVLPPQITHQRFLREMHLFCPFLKEFPSAIGELSHLEILHLASSCLELLEIATFVSLETLWACECATLKSIQGLAQLTKLRTLSITNCPVLEELAGVEHLRSLEEFSAYECVKLKSIRGSAQLTKLRTLNVKNCLELEELESVEHLRSLELLRVSGCVKLKSIRGLAQLTKLQLLDVSYCVELEELPGVEHLILEDLIPEKDLMKFFLMDGCPKLKLGFWDFW